MILNDGAIGVGCERGRGSLSTILWLFLFFTLFCQGLFLWAGWVGSTTSSLLFDSFSFEGLYLHSYT